MASTAIPVQLMMTKKYHTKGTRSTEDWWITKKLSFVLFLFFSYVASTGHMCSGILWHSVIQHLILSYICCFLHSKVHRPKRMPISHPLPVLCKWVFVKRGQPMLGIMTTLSKWVTFNQNHGDAASCCSLSSSNLHNLIAKANKDFFSFNTFKALGITVISLWQNSSLFMCDSFHLCC